MKMFKKLLVSIITVAALTASAASAATLSLHGTGQSHVVTNNDVLGGLNNTSIAMITGDQKNASNGLFLDIVGSAAEITYTFLGAEAGNSNFSSSGSSLMFDNRGPNFTAVGTQFTATQLVSGLLDFAFGTYAPRWNTGFFNNAGFANAPTSEYAMGFVAVSANTFYVLFDDIARGDKDFDDLVIQIDVAAVPLPAGMLLLLSAFGAAMVFRKRRAVPA